MEKKQLLPISILLILFGLSICYYKYLPSQIPIHWNIKGVADGFGSRSSVFMIPAIALISYILFIILPHFDVYKENLKKCKTQVFLFSLSLMLFFAGLHIAMLTQILGYDYNMNYAITPLFGALFIAIGLLLPKIKRNFFIGIRTPWTLSSDEVWRRTHELSAKVFIGIGALTIISMLFIDYALIVMLGLLVVCIIGILIYSYKLYSKLDKKKPDEKIPAKKQKSKR